MANNDICTSQHRSTASGWVTCNVRYGTPASSHTGGHAMLHCRQRKTGVMNQRKRLYSSKVTLKLCILLTGIYLNILYNYSSVTTKAISGQLGILRRTLLKKCGMTNVRQNKQSGTNVLICGEHFPLNEAVDCCFDN